MLPLVILLKITIMTIFSMINDTSSRPLLPHRCIVTTTTGKSVRRIEKSDIMLIAVFFDNMSMGKNFIYVLE